MKSKSYLAAVRDAARVIDVPGAPRSLRLDDVRVVGDARGKGGRVLLSWSFEDPESYEGDREPHGRRLRGVLDAGTAEGDPGERARSWWSAAQIDAGRCFKVQVDADWLPGEPWAALSWTVEEAWAALLGFLGTFGADVQVDAGEIRVDHGHEVIVYRIDPQAWVAHLNEPYLTGPPQNPYVISAANPVRDGLPTWVIDELNEVEGSNEGRIIALVAGALVGLEPSVVDP